MFRQYILLVDASVIYLEASNCAKIARTKWWKLRGEAAQAFKERMLGEGPWEGEDADDM